MTQVGPGSCQHLIISIVPFNHCYDPELAREEIDQIAHCDTCGTDVEDDEDVAAFNCSGKSLILCYACFKQLTHRIAEGAMRESERYASEAEAARGMSGSLRALYDSVMVRSLNREYVSREK